MPRMVSTKELILDAALDLFSRQGFDGTGIRDISGAVGIRESALYKHFRGKQEIFDSLVERMSDEYNKTAAALTISDDLSEMIEQYKNISADDLVKMTHGLFLYFVKNERAVKFRKLLITEQYRNERISGLYKLIYYENVLAYLSAVFKMKTTLIYGQNHR